MKQNGPPPGPQRPPAQSMATLLVWLAIASLSMLFVSSLLAIGLVGSNPNNAPRADLPDLPGGMWVSTLLLLLSSAMLHAALLGARRDNQPQVCWAMLATLLLGSAFLLNQWINWQELHEAGLRLQGVREGGFYFLTGLHAVHVLGGLVPMAFVTVAAFRGLYTRTAHHGLVLLGMYWHFLAVVWLIMFAFLRLF